MPCVTEPQVHRDAGVQQKAEHVPGGPLRATPLPGASHLICEPNGDVKPVTWHWFAIKGDDPQPLFAFAGVWRRYKGPIKKDGPSVELEVYSFLTTTPNLLVETINHERMPVLLTTEDEFSTWLNGTQAEAMSLARQHPPEQMQIVQQGFFKEDRVALTTFDKRH